MLGDVYLLTCRGVSILGGCLSGGLTQGNLVYLYAGECISGALQWNELVRIAMEIGFAPPILVTSTLYRCDDPKLVDMLGKCLSRLGAV